LSKNISNRLKVGTLLKIGAVVLVVTWVVLEDNVPEELVLDTYTLIAAILNFLRGFFLTNLVFSDAVCWILGGCVAFQKKTTNGPSKPSNSEEQSIKEVKANSAKQEHHGTSDAATMAKEGDQLMELTGWITEPVSVRVAPSVENA
jgi:hypothetical protein